MKLQSSQRFIQLGTDLRGLAQFPLPGHAAGAGVEAGVPGHGDLVRDVAASLGLEASGRQVAHILTRHRGQRRDLVVEVGEGLEQHILELQQAAHLMLQLLQQKILNTQKYFFIFPKIF